MTRRFTRYVWLAALVILLLIILRGILFSGLILARGDTFHYFYPYWDARSDAFAVGQLPLWTDALFMGAPLLANPQLGTFYPPNILLTPFSAPVAVNLSIFVHCLWAGIGASLLFRRTVQPAAVGMLIAGAVYAAGGFTLAHAEQINQLQGLAWMPWLFLCLHAVITGTQRTRWLVALAAALAMQIFTGHTQTVFISGVGLGVYALGMGWLQGETMRRRFTPILLLAAGALGGALLAVPQLLPTLELTGMSSRADFTLQQATAFSLPPSTLPRALLPNYDGHLFTEYIAYLGISGLMLALGGVIVGQGRRRWLWLMIGVIGLTFALGRFNPLYLLLANLPGFDLFRVPARWLALYTLAGAMLAGMGAVALTARANWRTLATIAAAPLLLALLARFIPADAADTVGAVVPSALTLALWAVAAFLTLVLRRFTRLLALVVCAELTLAAAALPVNHLVPPDVYLSPRFTTHQMQVFNDEHITGRLLAISGLNFDTGDKRYYDADFDRLQLNAQARHYAFTALKKQETLYPNLPLTWDIPSADGFGGGVLPTMDYTQFTSLLLPPDTLRTVDGRLGEILARAGCLGGCIPPETWLDKMNVRYLLTDKVFDIWHDDIAYDTTFYRRLSAGDTVTYTGLDFTGTALDVLYSGDAPPQLDIVLADGESVAADDTVAPVNDAQRARHIVETPFIPAQIHITAADDTLLLGVSHVDTRTGDFVQLQPAGWTRILSSDIKIYEQDSASVRLVRDGDAAPLATFPDTWQGREDALMWLRDHPAGTVIHADMSLPAGDVGDSERAEIITRTATQVEVSVQADAPAVLVLSDAWYPGWTVTVNEAPADLYRADVMFRAVPVPAGESRVVFTFTPVLWYVALIVGGVAWLVALLVFVFWRR